jgi:hypothetical protein
MLGSRCDGGCCEVTKPILMRLLVAAAIACGAQEAGAQTNCDGDCRPPPPPPPTRSGPFTPPPPSHSDSGNSTVYAITGVIGAIAVLGIWNFFNPPPPPPTSPPPPRSYPPDGVPPTQIQLPNVPQGGGPGGGGTAVQGPPLRSTCNLPPAGVTSFEDNRLLLDIPGTVSAAELDAIAARHDMTRQQTAFLRLTGRTLHVWQINSGASVAEMIRSVCTAERLIAGAQPNYLFTLAQDQQQEPVNSAQYAPQKLKLTDAHRLASGNKVLVALIDSEVDASHPDLAGAVTATFEASADDERPHSHGTGMAGAIAAHRTMLGSAPRVGLLTVRAFSSTANSAQGTTFNILKGLDWAADQGARVVNMSFAGPSDPRLHDALLKAYKRGMVLIAAAGNAGPNSPPLFPGADPSVIAVTATDSRDALFPGANRGNYIAVAAPGVDVFAPAPDSTYQLTTGTSVAAAEVSGVAALLIERNPALTPAAVRKILMDTATRLGPKGRDRDFGAGLVNALDAVTAAKPK